MLNFSTLRELLRIKLASPEAGVIVNVSPVKNKSPLNGFNIKSFAGVRVKSPAVSTTKDAVPPRSYDLNLIVFRLN